MTTHHITSSVADFTACKRRIGNRIDPLPRGDSLSVEWQHVDCFVCLATLPAGQPPVPGPVDHDKGRKPGRWTHDCSSCIYLDTRDDVDLYFHPDRNQPSVIARHGDDGENYLSGLAFTSREPFLALALVLALKRGLIRFEDALRRL